MVSGRNSGPRVFGLLTRLCLALILSLVGNSGTDKFNIAWSFKDIILFISPEKKT